MPRHSSTNRDARLRMRVPPEQMHLLQHASTLCACDVRTFAIQSALDAAHRVLADHSEIALTPIEQRAFVDALLAPPTAEPRLQRAAKDYLARSGG